MDILVQGVFNGKNIHGGIKLLIAGQFNILVRVR